MPDKITTLKLVDNTDVFPNIKDENVPNTIMRIADLSKYLNQLKSINITGDIGSTTITSDIATFTTADISTLNVSGISQFEGKSTFGSDVEVDGGLTLNSPSDLHFKVGDTNLDEFNKFSHEYYAHYAIYRFSGATFLNADAFHSMINWFLDATQIDGIFSGTKFLATNVNLTIPHFKDRIDYGAHAFAFLSDSNVVSLTIKSNIFIGHALFEPATSLNRIIIEDGENVKLSGESDWCFEGCVNLVEIGSIDLSEVTSLGNSFVACYKLKHIHMKNIPVSFNISASTQFEQSDLVEIISNLKSVSTTQTLTMGTTNLSKLTQDQILVATGKGWTLA